MRRIRHTHSKFAALNATTLTNEDAEDGGSGGGATGGTVGIPGAGLSVASGFSGTDGLVGTGENLMMASADDEILNEKVDERPWVMMMQGKGKKDKGKSTIARVGGIEIGEKNAWGCMQWANRKILEHVGFQGTCFSFWCCLFGLFIRMFFRRFTSFTRRYSGGHGRVYLECWKNDQVFM